MENNPGDIEDKYSAPSLSADNVRAYCVTKLPELETELQKVEAWAVEDITELHHLHIKYYNIRRINTEITLLKGLCSIADLIDFSDVANLDQDHIDKLFKGTLRSK